MRFVDSDRQREIARAFEQQYGGAPSVWARAPGRVDLMGSHTDYNQGFVLTLPISRDTWVAARRRDDGEVRAISMNAGAGEKSKWFNYVRGVQAVLQAEGFDAPGCDAVIHSTVPVASGLSSSAALECAWATAFESLGGWRLGPERKALLCQRAEHEFAGVKCGILDQFSACLGREGCALLLDCRTLSTRPVRIGDGISVMVANTMNPRRLSAGEYLERRTECEQGAAALGIAALRDASLETITASNLPHSVARRCRFIVEESARACSLAEAMETGDRKAIQRLLGQSYEGARDLYEIVSPAMAAMMKAMTGAPGVIGARQAGAGFGGCMVALVESEAARIFAESVEASFCNATGVKPDVYTVDAAAGACSFE